MAANECGAAATAANVAVAGAIAGAANVTRDVRGRDRCFGTNGGVFAANQEPIPWSGVGAGSAVGDMPAKNSSSASASAGADKLQLPLLKCRASSHNPTWSGSGSGFVFGSIAI